MIRKIFLIAILIILSVMPAYGITVNPTTDAQVWQGAPTTHYAGSTVITIGQGNGNDKQYISYLDFPIDDIPISSGIINLTISSSNSLPDIYELWLINESFTDGVTWNTKPLNGTIIMDNTTVNGSDTYVEFTVPLNILELMWGNDSYNFQLTLDHIPSTFNYIIVNSTENAVNISRPRLTYTTVIESTLNITDANISVNISYNERQLYYSVYQNDTVISSNDFGNPNSSFSIGADYNTEYSVIKQIYNNVTCSLLTASSASCTWNNSYANELINFSITGNSTKINRTIISNNNYSLTNVQSHIPLLSDLGEGYDTVLMNHTLSITDIATLIPPIPSNGIVTRHAIYNQDIYVSSLDDKYFIIDMVGTNGIIKHVNDNLAYNSTTSKYEGHDIGLPAERTQISIGLVNDPIYPITLNYSISANETIYQNLSFTFPDTSTMLPDDGLGILNVSRFTDLSIFPNATIGQQARHMAESVLLTRLLANYYPHVDGPIVFDGQSEYRFQRTALSVYRMIEGMYYFAQDDLKSILTDWAYTAHQDTVAFSETSISRFETNGSGYVSTSWSIATDSSYSGNGTLYTTTDPNPVNFSIVGDQLIIIYTKWNGAGIANISIDGVNYSIDMYNSTTAYQQTSTYNLSGWDANTIQPNIYSNISIYYTGTKNASSSGTQVDFDRFDVIRNDMIKQHTGYVLKPLLELNYTYFVVPFKENIDIDVNGTIYPYNITLFPTVLENRGATSYVSMEHLLYAYTVYQTDLNITWLENNIGELENDMQWTKQSFYEDETDLIRIPIWWGSHSFHDASYFTGYDSVDNSLYIQSADILAGFYTILNNTTMSNYWIAERDNVKNAMQKDISDGGLWINKSVGGHFILSKEPAVVRIEAEESEFINRSLWISYNDTSTVWDNGRKISGRAERAWSRVQRGPEDSAKIYYINNSTYPMEYTFFGTGISIVHGEALTRGIINITIDNITYQIDQYNSSCTTWCVDVVTDVNLSLPLQNHTVTFEWSGVKNASATDYIIDIDAVEIYNYTIEGFPAYSMTPMSVGVIDEWYKNATVDWIEYHDSGLKTDYTYPPIDLEVGADDADVLTGNYGQPWKMTYGQMAFFDNINSFENGGHFSVVAALYSRVKEDYTPMQQFVDLETGKYGVVEWFYDNGTIPEQSAYFETQMAGGFMMGYVPFWGGNYTTGIYSPIVESFSPNATIVFNVTDIQVYNLTLTDQVQTITWYLNGSQIQQNTSVSTATYTNNTAIVGDWNITAIAVNSIYSVQQIWNVTVINVLKEPPTPIITSMTYGDYWKNISFSAGIGNVTDGFNVSRNGTWYNGTDLYLNTTTTSGQWINDTIYAWNNSGDGTLSEGVNNNTMMNSPDTLAEYWDGSSWVSVSVSLDAFYFNDCYYITNPRYPDGVCPNYGQSSSQATIRITNNGTGKGIPNIYLNETLPTGITFFVDDDNAYPGSIELSNISQEVGNELLVGQNHTYWAWVNFSAPTSGWDGLLQMEVI